MELNLKVKEDAGLSAVDQSAGILGLPLSREARCPADEASALPATIGEISERTFNWLVIGAVASFFFVFGFYAGAALALHGVFSR